MEFKDLTDKTFDVLKSKEINMYSSASFLGVNLIEKPSELEENVKYSLYPKVNNPKNPKQIHSWENLKKQIQSTVMNEHHRHTNIIYFQFEIEDKTVKIYTVPNPRSNLPQSYTHKKFIDILNSIEIIKKDSVL